MKRACCVLLIDDHPVLREGLRLVFQLRLPSAIFAEATTVKEALTLEVTPDVVVLDINLPELNGLDGLVLLQNRWLSAGIFVLSAHDDTETRRLAMDLGAIAFVSKADGGMQIVEAIEHFLDSEKTLELSGSSLYLTPRQCEVLELLSQGLTNKGIARKLDLSDNTVRRHVQDIFAFLDVNTRTEAVFEARRKKFIR